MFTLIATLIFSSITASAQPLCSAEFAAVSAPIKKTLAQYPALVPRVVLFVQNYRRNYMVMPSLETFREREPQEIRATSNYRYTIYQQRLADSDRKMFTTIIHLILAMEHHRPADSGSLAFAKCLRDYMTDNIEGFAGPSYYDLPRSDLLARLHPEDPVAPYQIAGPAVGQRN